ncbi:hypothetical protein [Bradyrhizobium liaoningense]|uniref:hypothetical protein n=1 Tax=Bradyrhizobium liaoningense TaxID=43992 RepID=UPI00054DE435|nr:hypothetical protein [Bradyrhizobium liaoningense]
MSVGFAADIRVLFRDKDRSSMLQARGFDLWKYADVVARADSILSQLEHGLMPCDKAWPVEHLNLYKQWIADGKFP